MLASTPRSNIPIFGAENDRLEDKTVALLRSTTYTARARIVGGMPGNYPPRPW